MILTIILMALWIANAAMMLAMPYRRRPYNSAVDGYNATDSIPYLVSMGRCGPYVFVPLAWLLVITRTHLDIIKSPMDVVVIAFQVLAPGFMAYHWYKHANMDAANFVKVVGDHPMKVSRFVRFQIGISTYVFLIICGFLLITNRSAVAALPAGIKWAHILLICMSIYLTCRRPPWKWDVLEHQWASKVTYSLAVVSLLIYVNNLMAIGAAYMCLGCVYMLMGLGQPGDHVPKST